ncbi:MAG: SxtJ family membrane protein [Candidatus Sumerlaeota bacterium]
MLFNIDWNPTRRQLRTFGLTLFVMFPLAGAFFAARGESFSWAVFIAAAAIGCLVELSVLAFEPLARLLYKAWMGLALVLGYVVGPVVISIIYYLVITPIGLALRLTGKDPMQRRRPEGSCWVEVEHKTDTRSYGRQF